jgi:hypothetical protein
MSAASQFCSRCGAARHGGDRFCSKCGLDFWQAAAGREQPEAVPQGPPTGTAAAALAHADARSNTTLPLIAGLAWLVAAALTGYLAFLQLQFSGDSNTRLAEEARNLAIGNGVSAAITVFFGAKLLIGADRRFLFNSAAWGALSVAWGAYQISQGVTADVFIAATVAAGVAGIVSLVAGTQRDS